MGRILRLLLLQVAMVALVLLVAEGAARLLFEPTEAGRRQRAFHTESHCRIPSWLLGMELAPNCQALPGRVSKNRFRTNELGLRGPPLADDGAVRILALGDSSTFGWRVRDASTWPRRLQALLDGRYGEGHYRVVNAGIPGWTSYQGLLWLRERGLALDPEIAIVSFGFNDASALGEVEKAIAVQRRIYPLVVIDDLLKRRSSFWRWARQEERVEEPRPVRVPPERYRHNLREITRLVRESGGHAMLLAFTTQTTPELAEELGVPLVVYRGPRRDIVHPTAAGYRQLAGQLLAALEGAGYLPDPAPEGAGASAGPRPDA